MDDHINVNVHQKDHETIIQFNIRHDLNIESQRVELLRIINIHFNILKSALYGQNTTLTPIPPSQVEAQVLVKSGRGTSNAEQQRYKDIIQQQTQNNSMEVKFIEEPTQNRKRHQDG